MMDAAQNIDQPTDQRPETASTTPSSRAGGLTRRRPWLRTAGQVLVVVLLAGAMWWWWDRRRYESTDNAQIDGYIYPISARINGQIASVHVQDGQAVTAGTLLVEIDERDYQSALAKAKADYENAEAAAAAAELDVPVSQIGSTSQIRTAQADVGTAEAGVVAAQRQVEQAQAQLAQARASAKATNADVERYKPLIDKREISQQQFDQAVATADAANAAVTAAEAAVRASQEQVRQANERVHQAQAGLANARATTMTSKATSARAKAATAQVASAQAALQQATLNLAYAKVTAPADGIIGRRAVQVGQNVQPGQELLTVVPTTDLWVTANFKETQLARMKAQAPVDIAIDGCDREVKGHVTTIGAATGARFSLFPPENATGNYVKVVQRIPVRIDFDQIDQSQCLLRLGMSVVPSVRVR